MADAPTYTLLICPVCLEQVRDDRDWGPECHHEEYGIVDPIEVRAEAINLSPAAQLARFRLSEQKRDVAFRDADAAWWWGLPEEERKRRKEVARAKMSPTARALDEMLDRMRERMNRPSVLADIVTIPTKVVDRG